MCRLRHQYVDAEKHSTAYFLLCTVHCTHTLPSTTPFTSLREHRAPPTQRPQIVVRQVGAHGVIVVEHADAGQVVGDVLVELAPAHQRPAAAKDREDVDGNRLQVQLHGAVGAVVEVDSQEGAPDADLDVQEADALVGRPVREDLGHKGAGGAAVVVGFQALGVDADDHAFGLVVLEELVADFGGGADDGHLGGWTRMWGGITDGGERRELEEAFRVLLVLGGG